MCDIHKLIEQLIERVQSHISMYLNLEIKAGVGQVKEHYASIPDSLEEAFQNLYNSSHSSLESEVYQKQDLLIRTFDFYQQLYQAMLNGETDTKQIVQKHMEIIKETKPNEQFLQYFAYELLNFLLNISKNTTQIHTNLHVVVHAEEWKSGITKIKNFEQLNDWVSNLLSNFNDRKYLQINAKHKQVVDFMVDYIHKHYGDDLTLERLASELFLTKNYLNQIFKKAIGETFNQYLNERKNGKSQGYADK